MSDNPKTILLKDYKVPPFLIESVSLEFDLFEEYALVKSKLEVVQNKASNEKVPLRMAGEDLELVSVVADGQKLSPDAFEKTEKEIIFKTLTKNVVLEITTKIKPQENTKLEGLYKSSGNFCTQCEAEGFRRITYYLDRPDVMSKFTVRVTADKKKYPVLLSNGNLEEQGDLAEGRHFVKWVDPFPKPSYLFALVAGDLAHIRDSFITQSGRKVDLRIYVEKENIDQCDHAMLSLKNSMKWDEERFGREYDLDIFNIVAVSDFNMGAMENKSLNVFNSAYVLAKPETATDMDYSGIEGVIGHEYFHNWSGNRITCRDWFQLSLKEGLTVFRDQEFSSDMQSRSVVRIMNVAVLRTSQFVEDGSPMAHSVRPEEYAEINNFYTATVYNKGAEVIRMIHTLLGEKKFRGAMDLYFSRHDGQAVTIDDFVQCMQDYSGFDFSQFKRWYSQAGTPIVKVGENYDAKQKTYELIFEQSCPDTYGQKDKKPFLIPVKIGLLDKNGNAVQYEMVGDVFKDDVGELVFQLKESKQNLLFKGVNSKPIPSILRDFSAPVKIDAKFLDEYLGFLSAYDSNDFNRWESGQKFATNIIFKNIGLLQKGEKLHVSKVDLDVFKTLIEDQTVDNAFKALALELPSEKFLGEQMKVIDVVSIARARKFLITEIASHCKNELLHLYKRLSSNEPYIYEKESFGRRTLRNKCLFLLSHLGGKEEIELAVYQFHNSNNMTESFSALSCLNGINCPEREMALNEFVEKWQNDKLVLDKWFGLQASSDIPNRLAKIKELLHFELFDIKNPNKVRALIGGFCVRNLEQFHADDGSGYSFLADFLLEYDKLNPQVSARLVNPLIHWRRYDEGRQKLIKTQLEKLKNAKGISNDVAEIVGRALA